MEKKTPSCHGKYDSINNINCRGCDYWEDCEDISTPPEPKIKINEDDVKNRLIMVQDKINNMNTKTVDTCLTNKSNQMKKVQQKQQQIEDTILMLTNMLPAEKLIVTGSFALSELGLYDRQVKDLDIILIKPTDHSMEVLKQMNKMPANTDYPESSNHFRLELPDKLKVDVWTYGVFHEDTIELKNFIVASPKWIVKAKKIYSYTNAKHIAQLKIIAEIFYKPADLLEYIEKEQSKLLK